MTSPLNLKELKAIWYRKLAESGFNDIESARHLKYYDSLFFQYEYTPDTFRAKETYYYYARHMLTLEPTPFKSKVDRYIWTLHSEGIPMRDIADYLCHNGHAFNKDKVNAVVKRLRVALMHFIRNGGDSENIRPDANQDPPPYPK